MSVRRGWPLLVLVVLLVALPIFEVWLLIQVAGLIGGWPTVGILVLEAVLGTWLMRHQGARAWTALNDAYSQGKVPTGQLADAALVLVGGLLLILPGFVSDLFGFLFLLPFTRPFARKFIAFFVARRISRLGVPVAVARADRANLIEGETVEPTPRRPQEPSGPIIIAGEIEEPRTR